MSTIWAVIVCASLATNVVLLLGVFSWSRAVRAVVRDPARALTALLGPSKELRGRAFCVQSTGNVVEIDPTEHARPGWLDPTEDLRGRAFYVSNDGQPMELDPGALCGFDPEVAAFFEAAHTARFDVGAAIRDESLWAPLGDHWTAVSARYRHIPNVKSCGSPAVGYCAMLPGPKCKAHGGPATVAAGHPGRPAPPVPPEPGPCDSCVRRRAPGSGA